MALSEWTDTGLYTLQDTRVVGWHHIHNSNVDRLNQVLLKVQGLRDVDTSKLKDGSILVWDVSSSKWTMRKV